MSNELRKQIEKKILDCNHILRQRAEHWEWELHETNGKQKAYKDVLGLLADYHEKLREKSFTLSENIHDKLIEDGVKGSGYAKLVNDVVWAWFTKELGLE